MLKKADDVRVAALSASADATFGASPWDELRYAHSLAVGDTRAHFRPVLLGWRLRHLGNEHAERNFTFSSPGIALMTGRARVRAAGPSGEADAASGRLAVWRKEGGV